MLVVETIAKIRRAYFVQKKAIKEICRELKISRKTVRRVLRSGTAKVLVMRTGRRTEFGAIAGHHGRVYTAVRAAADADLAAAAGVVRRHDAA